MATGCIPAFGLADNRQNFLTAAYTMPRPASNMCYRAE